MSLKSTVQNLMAVPWIRAVHQRTAYGFLRLASCSRLLSAFVSSFLTGAFLREQHAVMKGRARYYRKTISGTEVNWTLIRRNTHRLEKGLVLRPRKSVFALNYIGETVDEFLKISTADAGSTARWCRDVLREYFANIEPTELTARLERRFTEHVERMFFQQQVADGGERQSADEVFAPYLRDRRTDISFESFLELAVIRRSVRYFEDKPVKRELLDRAFSAASQAPSACNRQPFRYLVFDTPEEAAEIASIPFGTLGYGDRVPCVLVVVGSLDQYPSPRDRHVIYIDGALSSMSLMYALETLELSSCPINWPDFGPLEAKMARRLKLEPYERPIMLIAVGHPDRTVPIAYSRKKPIDELREYRSKA
ncbi:MAG: nitroreductase family protein [Kiritimatiellia bacterium]